MCNPLRNDRGAILMMVLAFAIVVSLAGLAFLEEGRQETHNSHMRVESEQAFWLAEAGYQRFMAEEYADHQWFASHRTFSDTLTTDGTYNLVIRDTTVASVPAGTTPYRILSTGIVQSLAGTSRRRLDLLVAVPSGINLGSAGPGNYAGLSLGGGADVTISGNASVQAQGSVGVPSPGDFTISGGALITGTLYMNTGGVLTQTGGSVVPTLQRDAAVDAQLAQARTDAIAASASYAALAPTIGTTSLSGNMTVAGVAGVNVLSVTVVNVGGGKVLTLTAPSGGVFVINVSGTLTVSGGGMIALGGGLTPADVLFNVTGTGAQLAFSGGNTSNGLFLAPLRSAHLSSGSVTGEIIVGGTGLTVSGSGRLIGVAGGTPGSLQILKWKEISAYP